MDYRIVSAINFRTNKFYKLFVCIIVLQLFSISMAYSQFDIQGHRGSRGNMPENTIPAFIKAIESGVTTLELDVVITADNKVLVSHEPFMSHVICKTPEGKEILKSEEKTFNIYKMSAEQAQKFDCGEKFHPGYPDQVKMKINKPLLSEVIDTVESYIAANNLKPVWYNIETKCTPSGDTVFHPDPSSFADLVMQVVSSKNVLERTLIQSFDVRTLQHLHQLRSKVQLVLLVENLKGVEYNLINLGFAPSVYSPYYKLVNKQDIKLLHSKVIRVIPWTVNNEKDMKKLIDKGVDGIITDYPERLRKCIASLNSDN